MMSCSKNEAVNSTAFNLFTRHFVEFEQYFCSKTDYFTGNLGANMIEHVSEVELYIFLSTLEKFECWNLSFNHEILAGETMLGAWSSPIVHIGRFLQTINVFIILLSTTGLPCPKELSSDVTPHSK